MMISVSIIFFLQVITLMSHIWPQLSKLKKDPIIFILPKNYFLDKVPFDFYLLYFRLDT